MGSMKNSWEIKWERVEGRKSEQRPCKEKRFHQSVVMLLSHGEEERSLDLGWVWSVMSLAV